MTMNESRKRLGLRTRVMAVFMGLTIVPILIVAAAAIYIMTQQLETDLTRRAQATLELVHALIQGSQEELLALSRVLGTSTALQVDLSLDDMEHLHDLLAAQQQAHRVDGLVVSDAAGRVVAESGALYPLGADRTELLTFPNEPAAGLAVGHSPPASHVLIKGVSPITMADGTRVGFIEAGRMLDVPFLNRLKAVAGADLRVIVDDRFSVTTLQQEAAADPARRRQGAIVLGRPLRDLRGHERGMLQVIVSRAPTHAAQQWVMQAIVTISILMLLLAFGIGVVFARGLTHPIIALAQAAERIAGGDLHQRVETTASDELGQLTEAFNTMAENLSVSLEKEKSLAVAAARGEAEARRAEELQQAYEELRALAERLEQANAELVKEVRQRQEAQQALKEEKEALERMNRIMMDRESRILEMKQEVNALLQELGRTIKYQSV